MKSIGKSVYSFYSPNCDTMKRVVNYDEKGNEFITYEVEDLRKYQASLGFAESWSLNSLLKAGINPDFPIQTGNSTRLDGISQLADFVGVADSLIGEVENVETKNE